MHEILRHLPTCSLVLDLGSGQGSFDAAEFPELVSVRVDLEMPPAPSARFVQADAARLPFGPQVFDAVICNHSLEHFPELDSALLEIGRVLKPEGAFFASLPDGSTLTDRIYRRLARGGGHVNQIVDVGALIRRIESKIPLRHRGTRLLFTSLSFLNSRSPTARPIPSLVELGIDSEPFLALLTWSLRNLDRVLGTRMSVYGWALYFGTIGEKVDERPWANLCVRCGSAHPSRYLFASGAVVGGRRFRRYLCPHCGATNLFTPDEAVQNIT